jgi:hypothetical protein
MNAALDIRNISDKAFEPLNTPDHVTIFEFSSNLGSTTPTQTRSYSYLRDILTNNKSLIALHEVYLMI